MLYEITGQKKLEKVKKNFMSNFCSINVYLWLYLKQDSTVEIFWEMFLNFLGKLEISGEDISKNTFERLKGFYLLKAYSRVWDNFWQLKAL